MTEPSGTAAPCTGETTIGAWREGESVMFLAECSVDDGRDCGWSVDLREKYGEMVTANEVRALDGLHNEHRRTRYGL